MHRCSDASRSRCRAILHFVISCPVFHDSITFNYLLNTPGKEYVRLKLFDGSAPFETFLSRSARSEAPLREEKNNARLEAPLRVKKKSARSEAPLAIGREACNHLKVSTIVGQRACSSPSLNQVGRLIRHDRWHQGYESRR